MNTGVSSYYFNSTLNFSGNFGCLAFGRGLRQISQSDRKTSAVAVKQGKK